MEEKKNMVSRSREELRFFYTVVLVINFTLGGLFQQKGIPS
jgi:hypothetical protein